MSLNRRAIKSKLRKSKVEYNCQNCDKNFSRSGFKYHISSNVCKRSKNAMPKEYKTLFHNGLTHFRCLQSKSEECGKLIPYHINKVKKHYQKYHSDPEDLKYACEYCEEKFAIRLQLKCHHKKRHDPKYSCTYCSRTFEHIQARERHERTHKKISEEEKCRCHFCNRTFNDKYRRKEHEKTHDPNKKYHTHTCSTCGKKFLHKHQLENHMTVHIQKESRPTYQCHLCGKAYKSESGFRGHREKIHNLEHICGITEGDQICSKQFSSYRNLAIHQREIHDITINIDKHHTVPVQCNQFENSKAETRLSIDSPSIGKILNISVEGDLIQIPSSNESRDEKVTNDTVEATLRCPVINCISKFDSDLSLNQHLKLQHKL